MPGIDEATQKRLFKEYLSEKTDNSENFVDSENEGDYYWGDDDSDVGTE